MYKRAVHFSTRFIGLPLLLLSLAGADQGAAEKELPPLTGVEDLIAANEPAKDDAGANSGEPEANASSSEVVEHETATDESPISNGLVVAVVLVSGILLIGTFVLNKNREQ